MDRKIVLAILGPGKSGKTTVSYWLTATYGFHYQYSTSEFAARVIPLPSNHADRRLHRAEWAQAIADFNNEDEGIKLYKLMLEDHDILDGIRRARELEAVGRFVRSQGRLFVPIWVDRDVPADPACHDVSPVHCRFTINNRGDLEDLRTNLLILCRGLRNFQ